MHPGGPAGFCPRRRASDGYIGARIAVHYGDCSQPLKHSLFCVGCVFFVFYLFLLLSFIHAFFFILHATQSSHTHCTTELIKNDPAGLVAAAVAAVVVARSLCARSETSSRFSTTNLPAVLYSIPLLCILTTTMHSYSIVADPKTALESKNIFRRQSRIHRYIIHTHKH